MFSNKLLYLHFKVPAVLFIPFLTLEMAAWCLKKLLDQTIRNEASITRYFASLMVQQVKWTVVSHSWVDHAQKGLIFAPRQAFCTYDDAEDEPKGKKLNPNARKTVGSVGRKIPHRMIQLIDENGENQGTMHRADVIRILDERELKLVLLKETADPPVYRLMSGQQIHEERLKLREKQKTSNRTGTCGAFKRVNESCSSTNGLGCIPVFSVQSSNKILD